jgi:cytochrome c peroxidase
LRRDLGGRPEFCGRFKTPTLRNVATRKAFYHNGVFHTLEDAVGFYATRDTNPEKWYPLRADGSINKFDDLPAAYHPNVDTDPPFGGPRGGKPRISPQDVTDIVAFLRTLTDGFDAPAGGAALTQRAGR